MARSRLRWTAETAAALRTLPRTARLCWRLLGERRVSVAAKLIPLAALVYVVVPVDLLPDWLPVLGQLDDLGLLLGATAAFVRACPPEVVEEHRRAVERRPAGARA
jgi:uncharacterized membrane protein YkvA (DUF1232 family)